MKKHLDGIQSCRAVAALLVVVYHNAIIYFPLYTGLFDLKTQFRSGGPSFFDFGHAGVDFFFVLSGFIILWVHQADIGRPDRFSRYFWRRTIRIYPTYWVVLALLLPIYFIRPDMGGGYERDPSEILQSFLLFPQAHLPIVPASWTLSHELLFYAIFAVLLFNRRAGLLLLGAW